MSLTTFIETIGYATAAVLVAGAITGLMSRKG